MKSRAFVAMGLLGLAAVASACSATTEDVVSRPQATSLDPAGKPSAKAAQLNLSHIECTPEGQVLAHFVLLFAGSGTPGDLTGTYDGGAFGPVAPWKNTGNVWHYNVILPAGDIDIFSASATTAGGDVVSLHNPGEYAGDYQCSPPQECAVSVEPHDVFCTDQPMGNPGDECAAFGLDPQGKDDNLNGTSFAATQDALLAIVKSGTHGCENGSSAYRVYVDVKEGDTLLTPADQDISHVTYCACPDPL